MLAVRLIGYVAFETGGYRAGALGGSAGQIERNADGTLEDLFGHYPSAKIGLDTGAVLRSVNPSCVARLADRLAGRSVRPSERTARTGIGPDRI